MQWCYMLVLIYFQYVCFLLLPATNGLALISPILSWLIIRFIVLKNYSAMDVVIRSHLYGQMMIGVWTFLKVTCLVLAHGIIDRMDAMGTGDKQIAFYGTFMMAIYVTVYFYFTVVINLRRFKRGCEYQSGVRLPLTKSRYDAMKLAFSPPLNNSNVQFK